MTALSALATVSRIRRGWPHVDGTLTFEQHDDSGRIRAGRINPDGSIHLADFAVDPALPSLEPPASGDLVVHRLSRRAVIINDTYVRKCVRDGKATALARVTTKVGRLCAIAGLASAHVQNVDNAHVDFSRINGSTLHSLGEAGASGWLHFATTWPELVTQDANDLPEHDAHAEATVLTRWLELAELFDALPELPRFRAVVEKTAHDLVAGPADRPLVLHRDLHDKQLPWDGSTLQHAAK